MQKRAQTYPAFTLAMMHTAGGWFEGRRHGVGTEDDARETYEGEFQNDVRSGAGVLTCKDVSLAPGGVIYDVKYNLSGTPCTRNLCEVVLIKKSEGSPRSVSLAFRTHSLPHLEQASWCGSETPPHQSSSRSPSTSCARAAAYST